MKHLTDEELAFWLAGEANDSVVAHLGTCSQCRKEAEAVRDGVLRYKLAVRHEAALVEHIQMMGATNPRKALVRHRLHWAAAGVVAVLLVAQTAWLAKSQSPETNNSAQVTGSQATLPPASQMSDDELLDAVNSDLSRDVPQALAPVSTITTARNEIAAEKIGISTTKTHRDSSE